MCNFTHISLFKITEQQLVSMVIDVEFLLGETMNTGDRKYSLPHAVLYVLYV